MPDGIDRSRLVEELPEWLQMLLPLPRLDGGRENRAFVIEDGELQAAGARVDHEDAHDYASGVVRAGSWVTRVGPSAGVHCQSRISGMSSPWDWT